MVIVGAEKLMWGTDIPSVVCYETLSCMQIYRNVFLNILVTVLMGVYN